MDQQMLMSPAVVESASSNQDRVVLLDTRDPAEFAKEHIPGAINVRDFFTYLATSDDSGVKSLQGHFSDVLGKAGLSGQETAVVYEDSMNTGFGQSCRGWLLLQSLGYENARILDGGLAAWKACGLPVTSEMQDVAPTSFPLDESAVRKVFVTREEILQALDDPAIKVLDVRDQDEWEGLSSSPYGIDFAPRKGRLKGAVWLEWSRLMEHSGRYIPTEYVISAMRQLGISREDKVYLYCFKGARASNTYVALRNAGFSDVKVYFASWNEWSRDPSLPIDDQILQVI